MARMMGTDSKTLLKNALGGNGECSISEFQVLWDSLGNSKKESTLILTETLAAMIAMTEKKNKNVVVNPNSLKNTAIFVALSAEIAAEKEDSLITQKNRALLANQFPKSQELCRILNLLHEPFERQLGPFVIGVSTLHTLDEIDTLAAQASRKDSYVIDGEGLFLFYYLFNLSRKEEKARIVILNSVVNKMLTLTQQLKAKPILAQSTLMALLHILRELMMLRPITDTTFIKRVLHVAQTFYLWPLPYGRVAKEILHLLQWELYVPGAIQRMRLIEDAQSTDKGERLHFFVDKNENPAITYLHIMQARQHVEGRKQTRGDEPCPLKPHTQALVILDTLRAEKIVQQTDLDNLRKLSAEQVSTVYQAMMDVYEEVQRKPEQAVLIRKKGMDGVQQLLATEASNPAALPVDLGDADLNSSPTLPDVTFVSVAGSAELELESGFGANLSFGKAKETQTQFPTSGLYDLYSILLQKYSGTRSEKNDFRVCIIGGGKTVHAMMTAHLHVLQNHDKQFKGLNVRFFIFPTGPNDIGAYIARHDAWYNRHIFTPFRSWQTFVPWINPQFLTEEKLAKEGDPLEAAGKVSHFFREAALSYVRGARFRCNINVYMCAIVFVHDDAKMNNEEEDDIKSSKGDEAASLYLPFCQRVEIGQGVEIAKWIKRNGKFALKGLDPPSPEEIMKDRDFTFKEPSLNMGFTKMDLSGHTKVVNIDETDKFTQLLFANIPRVGDKCCLPDPTVPWLEMYADLSTKGKKTILSAEPRQHVIAASIRSDDPQGIELLVDGTVVPGVRSVTISRMYTSADSQDSKIWNDVTGGAKGQGVIFPVDTFFPFDT